MSKLAHQTAAVTLPVIMRSKIEHKKLSMVTCYDAAFARLVEESSVDMVLVGDSLGNVMLGHGDTIPVTLDDMVHHCAAVARVLRRPFLVIDMPFMTCQVSVEKTLENCARAMQLGAAKAVKIEGGAAVLSHVKAVVAAGIPVMGHLGLTPQSVHALGGWRVQGRGEAAAKQLLADALALEAAGAFALVLEMVPAKLARQVTESLKIPVIGIGAGPGTDGQVLVLQDLLGFDDSFNPKFLKKYANLGATVRQALDAFNREVKDGAFPDDSHSFAD